MKKPMTFEEVDNQMKAKLSSRKAPTQFHFHRNSSEKGKEKKRKEKKRKGEGMERTQFQTINKESTFH